MMVDLGGLLADEDPTRLLGDVLAEMRRVIVGQDRMVERAVVCLLARGHCLIEGVPGLAKTLTVSTLARIVGGAFSRIQFTPDLVPADIVGTRIWRPSREEFDIEWGPLFANVVLADEINRAPAKVQSALLEAMAERHVSIGGQTRAVPDPFLVLATENPIESEGVYALPEAQRDRFLLQVVIGHPSYAEETEIARRMSVRPPEPRTVLSIGQLGQLQAAADAVFVHDAVRDYAVRLVMVTREPSRWGVAGLDSALSLGASPRATLGLVAAGRALALLRGRRFLVPQDIHDVAPEVLRHRLILSYDALGDGVQVDEVIARLLASVPAPRVVEPHDAYRDPVTGGAYGDPSWTATQWQPSTPERAALFDPRSAPPGEGTGAWPGPAGANPTAPGPEAASPGMGATG
jgi:MoxR-like ATPase